MDLIVKPNRKKKPKTIRRCIVPECKSNDKDNPNKIFIFVPRDIKIRKLWFEMARLKTYDKLWRNKSIFMCEDHFTLEEDMENYMMFKLMGTKKRMKPNAVPRKFDCQASRVFTHSKPERPAVMKLRRIQILNEVLQPFSLSVARKPGRKRKQSQDEDNELSEQKRDRSDSELNNSNKDGDVTNRFEFVNIAPIEEVLIKEEPTDEFIEEECVDEPSEEIIRREERIEGPSEEIVIKTERIDEHSEEIVVKEEQTDDYPTDSEVYDNLQIHMKSEVDEEKFQIPDQST